MGIWTFNAVSIIYFSAAAISFLLAYLSWRMRPARGAKYFGLMMLANAVWVSSYTLELFNTGFEWKILMFKFEFLGLAAAVYLWFVFVAVYSQFDRWLNKYTLILMAVVPVYFVVSVFQAPDSTSVYKGFEMNEINGLTILHKIRAVGFYIWTSYAYLTLGLGMILLILAMINLPRKQRTQVFLLGPAILVLIVPNFLHLTGYSIFYPYDPTPVALAIVGVLFIISIYVHKFIEVMPVAHAQVFKNMRSAVIIIDSRNKILEINPAAQLLLRKTQNEVVSKDLLTFLPECEGLILSDKIYSEIKSEITLEKINRIFELKINTLTDSQGTITGRILLLFDITEQKKAINELDAYARTVAHDLKSPLNAIAGYTQLLEASLKNGLNEDLKESLEGIKSGAHHMNDIVEGLLLLAQIRNLDNLDTTELEMNTIMKSSLNRLSVMIAEYNAKVKTPETLFNSIGYGIWVEEVWVNLFSNAIKYGGECPEIEVNSYRKGKQIYYTIKDNGSGLTPEEQENIFMEFTRLRTHKSEIAGHGLGLSIVKSIIEKLGGQVGVESKKGEGSTFYFSLPAKSR
ncbi:MAG TPA: hypothetical protein DDX98_05590 [Bacteroidales bacterium]|jgi:signal transduction histidine kinase|nr:hypothetical protein [Bacteroidales bacterium]